MSRIAPNHKRERSNVHESTGRGVSRQRIMEEGEVNKSLFDLVTRDLRSRNTAILEEALKQLRDAFNQKDDRKLAQNQDTFFALGAHATVVRVMSEHPDCKVLQEYGLRVFMGAMHKNNEVRDAVAKVNGMQVMLQAMKTYYAYQDIQFFGLKALKSLCYLTANSELLVYSLRAVPFIIETMNRYPRHAGITEVACGIFFEICCNKRLRTPLIASKAPSALATAYELHENHKQVQEAARRAMNILTSVEGW